MYKHIPLLYITILITVHTTTPTEAERKGYSAINHYDDWSDLIIPSQNNAINSIALHPNGKLLAIAYKDRGIECWHTEYNKKLYFSKQYNITALEFSPDGQQLAAGQSITRKMCTSHTSTIWTSHNVALFNIDKDASTVSSATPRRIPNKEDRATITFASAIQKIKYSNDGSRIAVGTRQTEPLIVFNTASCNYTTRYEPVGDAPPITDFTFIDNKLHIATDPSKVIDRTTKPASHYRYARYFNNIASNPSGYPVLAASNDRGTVVMLWDMRYDKMLWWQKIQDVTTVAPNGHHHIFAGTAQGHFWIVTKKGARAFLNPSATTQKPIVKITSSHDSTLVATMTKDEVQLYGSKTLLQKIKKNWES